jgi:TolB-like protein/DNA-binding SARP family transcriptional activator/Flp pilus assembly protein TadD
VFRLRMLGGLALEDGNGVPVAPIPKRRAEAVLAMLAMSGDRGCTRERLFALLWPESDAARSGHGLRDSLHAIRRVLGPGAVSGGQLLRLDPTVVACDVHERRESLNAGKLEEGVADYAGPLLDGFHVNGAPEFERWLDGERARLAREHGEVLEELARRAVAAGSWSEAVGWWGRAVEHDPLSSRLVLRQAEALAAMGDRANAVRLAEAHALRLREDLDIEPDGEFLSQVERIRNGSQPATRDSDKPPRLSAAHRLPSETPPATEPRSAPMLSERSMRRIHWAPPGRLQWIALAGAIAIIFALGFAASYRSRVKDVTPRYPRTAIAVLPFRSLSADSSTAYFVAGLHDELLTQLSRIASLKIIGRASVGEYEETSKPLRQISAELEVGSIVEASVQVERRQLRISVRLLDAATQAVLWTERYERTLDDAFAVQTEIAQQIVAGVGIALTRDDAAAMVMAPTQNTEAYQLYLQAMHYARRPTLMRPNLVIAQGLYEQALSLDSTFALAQARLAIVHFLMWQLRYDRTADRLAQARRAADAALRLAPQLPQARLAVGLANHSTRGAHREAREEFRAALASAPGDAEVWAAMGRAHRSLGSWDSALVAFDQARRLDPLDASLMISIGNTLHQLRRYDKAIEAYRRALLLGPDVLQTRLSIAWSYILWKGQLDTLRTVLQNVPNDADPGTGGGSVVDERYTLLMMERRPDSALALLRDVSQAAGANRRSYAHLAAHAHLMRGDSVAAIAAFDSAAVYLDSLSRARPEDFGVHAELGAVLAVLGRKDRALHELRWLEQHTGPDLLNTALLMLHVGRIDSALALLERLLSQPTTASVPYLRLDPRWAALVNHPRSAALLAKYASDS